MKNLKIDNTIYQIPSTWNEVDTWGVFTVATLMRSSKSVAELKVKLLLHIIEGHVTMRRNGDDYTVKTSLASHKLTSETLAVLSSKAFKFMVKEVSHEGEVHEHIYSKLTRNPYPVLPCSCKERLHGVDDGFANLTWGQFCLMQVYSSKMRDDRERYLDLLIATMYTKKGKSFSAESIEPNAALVRKASPTHKEAILLFYYGCLDFLAQKYPQTFSGGTEAVVRDVHAQNMKVLYGLSHGDVTKYEEVDRSNVHHVLSNIENAIVEQESRKN
ncbi:MAG: hypothetical protein ACRC9X_06450 [Bacteroidales bacterium]